MADVRVRDLVVEYPGSDYVVRPIDGLSLDAPAGSLTILLGPSGCGKTTLLSCLAGILTPTAGSIHVDGIDVGALRGAHLTAYRRRTVGVVFQAFNLVPSLTALENVAAPLLAARARRSTAMARARDLLHQVELAERVGHRPGDLSGGQQQRVALARSLVHDPPLVVADEPTAHLDYVQVEGILRLLRSIASSGRTVVVSTHDERMLPLADQVIELVPSFARRAGPVTVELAAGEVLFREGDMPDRVYVVDAGEIEILRHRPDGKEDRLAVFGAGEYFGEMGPIFNLPRTAEARACGGATVTGYSLDDFREIVGAEHLRQLLDRRPLPARPRTKRAAAIRRAPAKTAAASSRPARKPRRPTKGG